MDSWPDRSDKDKDKDSHEDSDKNKDRQIINLMVGLDYTIKPSELHPKSQMMNPCTEWNRRAEVEIAPAALLWRTLRGARYVRAWGRWYKNWNLIVQKWWSTQAVMWSEVWSWQPPGNHNLSVIKSNLSSLWMSKNKRKKHWRHFIIMKLRQNLIGMGRTSSWQGLNSGSLMVLTVTWWDTH